MRIKNIIYYDFGGSHSSVVAACIHAGKLNPQKIPDKQELMHQEYFDKTTKKDFGKVKFMGTDNAGNKIFSLGTKNSNSGDLLSGIINLEGISEQFVLCGTMPLVNTILRIGGWLSRSMSLPALGRPLVIMGIQKDYSKIVSFVEGIRSDIGGA